MRLFKRHGTNAWFLALYRLGSQGEDVHWQADQTEAACTQIVLTAGEQTTRHRLPRLR